MARLSELRLKHGLASLIGFTFLLATGLARSDAYDALNVTLGVNVMHDDNLFRLSSSADPRAVLGTSKKSDTITTKTLGIKFAKNYSLQRIEFDANLVDYKYNTFDYLSFTARNYSAAWRWSLTPRFHGNLTRTHNESLNSFTDYTGYNLQNVRIDEVTRLDGFFEFGPVHLIGGISRTERTNSEPFLAEGDSVYDAAEVGLRYAFPSGTSITALTRHGSGEYTNRKLPGALTDFDHNEQEVKLVWPISGKTRMEGRIFRVERQHDNFSSRDFHGTGGNINLSWMITGKTSLTAGLSRDVSSFLAIYSNYTVNDRFTVSPYWQMSAKTGLRLRYDYSRRSFRDPVVSTTFDGREDTTRLGSVAVEWRPIDALYLSATLQNDRRTSNKPGFDYKSNMGILAAQFTF